MHPFIDLNSRAVEAGTSAAARAGSVMHCQRRRSPSPVIAGTFHMRGFPPNHAHAAGLWTARGAGERPPGVRRLKFVR